MNAIIDRTELVKKRLRFTGERPARGRAAGEQSRNDPADGPALECDPGLPLVIDLEGSLLGTNTLHEALLILFKREWTKAWRLALWALKGTAFVKERLAALVTDEDVAGFPVNLALESFAGREARAGRQIVLATSADRAMAGKFQKRFPFVSRFMCSDRGTSLNGRAQAEELRRLYPNGFIYAGGSRSAIHIWRTASGAIFAGRSVRLLRKTGGVARVVASFPRNGIGSNGLRRGLRLHQWVKNALIFVPLVLGGKAGSAIAWTHAMEAFLALSLLASATYLVNDLLDLHEDRQHWSKRLRPLATGELSLKAAVGLIAVCGLAALLLSLAAGVGCLEMLALYLALSLAYSFRLKREPIVDVFLLATLFSMRLAIGVVVTGVAFSAWLLVFSMFTFLSLSLAKRESELKRMVDHGLDEAPGRGYKSEDAPFVLITGVASMMAAVIVMVIYLTQEAFPKGFYRHSHFLWGFAVIIFLWLARVWILCNRGELDDDPVAFALKDRLSLLYAALMGLMLLVAIL